MTTIGSNNTPTYYGNSEYDDITSPKTGSADSDNRFSFEYFKGQGLSDERAQYLADKFGKPSSSSGSSSSNSGSSSNSKPSGSSSSNSQTSKKEPKSESVDIEDQDEDLADVSAGANNPIDDSETYTAADLEQMGLDGDLADYIVENYGSDDTELTGKELQKLVDNGDLKFSSNGQLGVAVKTSDGYTLLELIDQTELSTDEAEVLVNKAGRNDILSKAAYDKYIDNNGQLTKAGESIVGQTSFKGNEITVKTAEDLIDLEKEYTQDELEDMGLSPEVAEYLAQEDGLPGDELLAMIEEKQLKAAKTDGELQLEPLGSVTQIPSTGLSMPALLEAGLSVEEAEWLMDAYGVDGTIRKEDIEKYLDISSSGTASFSDAAKEQYDLGSEDAETLLEDGATYEELIALGFSSTDTNYLIANFGDAKSKSVSQEKIKELIDKGFIAEDVEAGMPLRYMLQGEDGMTTDDADTAAAEFSAGTDAETPVLTFGENGNFFVSGEDATGPAAKIDLQQSVIYTRETNENGQSVGSYVPNNGNAQGLFDKESLKGLGFSQEQVDAIFEHAKSADTDDEVPNVITMSELKNAVKSNIADTGKIAEVVGQSVVMRQAGEALFSEQEYEANIFSPTQQEAEWIKENYGGTNGLTQDELAVALEDGVVQYSNGKILMTAHGKSLAYADKGPSDIDVNTEQHTTIRRAFNDNYNPNGIGNDRTINFNNLTAESEGNLSKGDARLILETYGKDGTITQDQFYKAIDNNDVTIIPGTPKGTAPVIEFTPQGYKNMRAEILNNPDSIYTQQVNGLLNYKDKQGVEAVDAEQLKQSHGINDDDAYGMIAQFDLDGDGKLTAEETLPAIMNENVKVGDDFKITEVNLDDKLGPVGPYTNVELASKITGDENTNPKPLDLAHSIFLYYGIDPDNNKGVQITDQQLEDYLRDHPYLTESEDGMISVAANGALPNVDDVWNKLVPEGENTATMPHNMDREGKKAGKDYASTNWAEVSTLNSGQVTVLANYLHNQEDMYGHLGNEEKPEEVKDTNLQLSYKDVERMVKEGIITLDGEGKVTLTPHGEALIASSAAADTMNFFNNVNKSEISYDETTGNRIISKDAWTDDKKYQEGAGEWTSRNKQIEAGYDPGEDGGATIDGFFWAVNQGLEHVVSPKDHEQGTIQHESITPQGGVLKDWKHYVFGA